MAVAHLGEFVMDHTGFLQGHNIHIFFALALALSWAAFIPYMYDPENSIPWFTFGPAAAAILTARLVSGTPEVRAVLAAVLRWKVNVIWYIVAIGFPFLAQYISAIMNPLFGSAAPDWHAIPSIAEILPAVALFLVFSGPLGEEIGWRGYALPLLLERYSALNASLILGSVWAVWHLPLILVGDFTSSGAFMPVIAAIVFTWVFQNSAGSVVIAIILHASNQNSVRYLGRVFEDADRAQHQWIAVFVWIFFAILILGVHGTTSFVIRRPRKSIRAQEQSAE